MKPVVEIEQVWKAFTKGETATSLRDLLTPGRVRDASARERTFWALQDISFRLEAGEMMGVIGANGAGKSTLLKILAGVLRPDRGQVRIRGKISALIEVTAGFHPDLTGRENVYLQGAILGMRRREVDRQFDNIVEFSGVRDFLDTPVKRYSSGMYVRLGFAVAVFVQPELLLIDEVLAVGDIGFQQKCFERINQLREDGTTIIFVSHNMELVGRLCKRTLYLKDGRIQGMGKTRDVLTAYEEDMLGTNGPLLERRPEEAVRSGKVRITRVAVRGDEPGETSVFEMGRPMRVRISYHADERIETPLFGIGIFTADGIHCVGGANIWDGYPVNSIEGEGAAEVFFPELTLTPGMYIMEVSLWDAQALVPYDFVQRACWFKVVTGRETRGLFYLPRTWRFLPGEDHSQRD